MVLKILKVIGIILLVVLVLAAIIPLLLPVPAAAGTGPVIRLADPDSRFMNVNGVNLHYKIFGQGQPYIILLHGFGASTFSWREVIGPLSKTSTVVAYDRPAFGLTERPLLDNWKGENPYSPDAQVVQLAGLMDQLKIEKAILIGNSAGGGVAANFYLKYPERVQGLVFVDPAISSGSSGSGPYGKYSFIFSLPQMRFFGPLLVRSIQESGMQILYNAWHDQSRITPEIIAGYRKPLQADNWDRGLWELTKASIDRPDIYSRLSEFMLPVLVITGDDDRIMPTKNSVKLAGDLPDAKLVVIPNAGHVPQEESPALFLQAVAEYVGQISKGM